MLLLLLLLVSYLDDGSLKLESTSYFIIAIALALLSFLLLNLSCILIKSIPSNSVHVVLVAQLNLCSVLPTYFTSNLCVRRQPILRPPKTILIAKRVRAFTIRQVKQMSVRASTPLFIFNPSLDLVKRDQRERERERSKSIVEPVVVVLIQRIKAKKRKREAAKSSSAFVFSTRTHLNS